MTGIPAFHPGQKLRAYRDGTMPPLLPYYGDNANG